MGLQYGLHNAKEHIGLQKAQDVERGDTFVLGANYASTVRQGRFRLFLGLQRKTTGEDPGLGTHTHPRRAKPNKYKNEDRTKR